MASKKKDRKIIAEIKSLGNLFRGYAHRKHRTNKKKKDLLLKKLKLEKVVDKEYKKTKNNTI